MWLGTCEEGQFLGADFVWRLGGGSERCAISMEPPAQVPENTEPELLDENFSELPVPVQLWTWCWTYAAACTQWWRAHPSFDCSGGDRSNPAGFSGNSFGPGFRFLSEPWRFDSSTWHSSWRFGFGPSDYKIKLSGQELCSGLPRRDSLARNALPLKNQNGRARVLEVLIKLWLMLKLRFEALHLSLGASLQCCRKLFHTSLD